MGNRNIPKRLCFGRQRHLHGSYSQRRRRWVCNEQLNRWIWARRRLQLWWYAIRILVGISLYSMENRTAWPNGQGAGIKLHTRRKRTWTLERWNRNNVSPQKKGIGRFEGNFAFPAAKKDGLQTAQGLLLRMGNRRCLRFENQWRDAALIWFKGAVPSALHGGHG